RPPSGPAFLLPLLLLASPVAMAADALPAPAPVSDPVPVADRSMLFATDIDRLVASQPVAARPEPAPKMSERVHALLRRATALLGTPYRWGGESENGFDGSGLVGYVFKTALGVGLPRGSGEMARSGQEVDRDALSAGDRVFFSRRGKRVD